MKRCKICDWDSSAGIYEVAYRCERCHTWVKADTGEEIGKRSQAKRIVCQLALTTAVLLVALFATHGFLDLFFGR
jgi:hypothetical protein